MNLAQFTLFDAAKRLRLAWMYQNRTEVMASSVAFRESRLNFALYDDFFSRAVEVADTSNNFPCHWIDVIVLEALTIGNESDIISHVVIDEGGQCHSAYAVSALMRARQALVIGDVHQLEPVLHLEY